MCGDDVTDAAGDWLVRAKLASIQNRVTFQDAELFDQRPISFDLVVHPIRTKNQSLWRHLVFQIGR
ncbi:hypothetical protein CUJ84_Chr002854 [Rhizobium leguminosarum]|uniref:Uncharacterized protein n=1 Tax=Rhizobium leguminosarum TaxID=384 RepID=A0A2K9Z4N6_RHILE|nr:hypothetical protein CUJ84_Chr002854 [Rhizobium leguminosarum]